jgi:hypothetical protein
VRFVFEKKKSANFVEGKHGHDKHDKHDKHGKHDKGGGDAAAGASAAAEDDRTTRHCLVLENLHTRDICFLNRWEGFLLLDLLRGLVAAKLAGEDPFATNDENAKEAEVS